MFCSKPSKDTLLATSLVMTAAGVDLHVINHIALMPPHPLQLELEFQLTIFYHALVGPIVKRLPNFIKKAVIGSY